MAKRLTRTLVGGRYDGFAFDAEDGWRPGKADLSIVLDRPDPAEWERAVQAAGGVVTTTLVPVPFRSFGTTFPENVNAGEVYLRCDDGVYRSAKFALRCS